MMTEPAHTSDDTEVEEEEEDDEEDNETPEIPDQEGDGKDDVDDDDDEDDDDDGFVFQRIPCPSKGIVIKEPPAQGERTFQQTHKGNLHIIKDIIDDEDVARHQNETGISFTKDDVLGPEPDLSMVNLTLRVKESYTAGEVIGTP
ncbi:hypothetical protein L6452_22161 [Arctium lappa]|uniref:Uncharacterized protein n=1 Tax=Arctium lappa TaxID=4217 RepID=A0ACB9AYM5_ARCLA|nr:hypothetical protein L6452_22161 [Arctium lappa]